MKHFYVYILASQYNGTLYVGITSDLVARVFQHRNGQTDGFTKKYIVNRLVWFEEYALPTTAIEREKQLKKWNRAWKIRLIEKSNPRWNDLYPTLL